MPRPDDFYASIGGYMGSSYCVELNEGLLVYTRSSRGYETEEVVEIEPTDAQWAQFVEVLDDVDFWNWEERYHNPDICDGTGWTVRIEIDGRGHESAGVNEFPGPSFEERMRGDAPEDRPFEEFTTAVQELIGGRKFS